MSASRQTEGQTDTRARSSQYFAPLGGVKTMSIMQRFLLFHYHFITVRDCLRRSAVLHLEYDRQNYALCTSSYFSANT